MLVALVLLRVSRRVLASHRGSAFSISRTYVYTAVYVLIGAGFSGLSFAGGVPYLLALPEAAAAAAAAVGSYLYSDKRIVFWKEGEVLYFRGGVIIYPVYLTALVARLALDLAILGPSAFSLSSAPLSGAALCSTMATDVLLTFGVGLLLGRGARLAVRHGRISGGKSKRRLPGPPRERRTPATLWMKSGSASRVEPRSTLCALSLSSMIGSSR
jgi:hypothetical protein